MARRTFKVIPVYPTLIVAKRDGGLNATIVAISVDRKCRNRSWNLSSDLQRHSNIAGSTNFVEAKVGKSLWAIGQQNKVVRFCVLLGLALGVGVNIESASVWHNESAVLTFLHSNAVGTGLQVAKEI